ncbi:MAG: acyl-CoA dehydrogenase [Haliea sp.]|jgi:alkylation response protein AidB-like acyl-CoA dehydrogenase|nr:acyl-CoA dehydrogenase [Haliea sp.]
MGNPETFYKEALAWLEANCPQSQRTPASREELVYGGNKCVFPSDDAKTWLELMAARGWTVPTWPKEYGGAGLSSEEAGLLQKAMRKLGCRSPLIGHGLWMLGPALLEYGTREQKLQHLPGIARGEIRWCQGYSEPGAGSDLASLRCRCEDKGDHFLVNGQKSWTTDGNHADWIFVLVRTDFDNPAKQAGISFLLIDLESAGVEVKPCTLLDGNEDFCDTFFDNVVVPRENLVGDINEGWAIAKSLLVHERTMMSQIQEYIPRLPHSVVEYARNYVGLDENGQLADDALRGQLTSHLMNAHAMQLAQQRAFEERRAGVLDKRSTLYFKAWATEEDQRKDELLLAMLGSAALGWEGDGFSDDELQVTRQFLTNKALTIGGGTTEVQLNLMARALGLPGREV